LPVSWARTGHDSNQGRVSARPPLPRRNPLRLIGPSLQLERSVMIAPSSHSPGEARVLVRALEPKLLAQDNPHDHVREATPVIGIFYHSINQRAIGGQL
jgi:hypothetical protein